MEREKEQEGWALRMAQSDDVACAMSELSAGTMVEIRDGQGRVLEQLEITQNVPRFHKLALKDFAEGDCIHKYGEIIGKATCTIARGDYVHTHNVTSAKVS